MLLYLPHPVNTRGEFLIPYAADLIPWGITESSLELSPGISASTTHSEFIDWRGSMQHMTRYSGGGGSAQNFFIRECSTTYERMKNSSAEHELEGFGELEFVKQLSPILERRIIGISR